MKKPATIILLTLAITVAVAFSSCTDSGTSKAPTSEISASDSSTTAPATSSQKLSTSQLYDYFSQHSSALNALIQKGSFSKNSIDDGTMIHFALLELIQRSKSQLISGKIDQATFETQTQEFYKDEVNLITTNFFGKTPENYETEFSFYAQESGGIVPVEIANENEIRFLPIETKSENAVYNTTFNVYSFGSGYQFDENEVKLGDPKHNSQIIGTVTATYTITVNKTDKSSFITFDKFSFTKAKS